MKVLACIYSWKKAEIHNKEVQQVDDKAKKVTEKINASFNRLAESQSTIAIGKATVALVEQGKSITVEGLIEYLRGQGDAQSSDLVRTQNEAAERELLAAQTKSRSQ